MFKRLVALVVPLLMLALAAPAWADDINIIFDPTPAEQGTFYLIQQPFVTYDVSWGSCTQNGVPSALQGDAACMLFINQTGAPLGNLNLTFTVNNALAGQTITCTNTDSFLTGNNCTAAGTLTLNETVTVNLFGGSAVPDEMAFFIAENGVTLSNLPPLTFEVPTHDPNTLVLLVAGVAMLAMCGLRRYA
jgi:hypothetical protein